MSPDPAKIQIKENLKKLSDSEDNKNCEIGENIALQVQALSQTSVNTCVTTINDSTVASNPNLSESPNTGNVITVGKNAKFTFIGKISREINFFATSMVSRNLSLKFMSKLLTVWQFQDLSAVKDIT